MRQITFKTHVKPFSHLELQKKDLIVSK